MDTVVDGCWAPIPQSDVAPNHPSSGWIASPLFRDGSRMDVAIRRTAAIEAGRDDDVSGLVIVAGRALRAVLPRVRQIAATEASWSPLQ